MSAFDFTVYDNSVSPTTISVLIKNTVPFKMLGDGYWIISWEILNQYFNFLPQHWLHTNNYW